MYKLNKQLHETLESENDLALQFFNTRFLKDIVNQFIKLRRARDITQGELAEQADTNRTYLTKIENGAENVSIKTLNKVANALGYVIEANVISIEDKLEKHKPVENTNNVFEVFFDSPDNIKKQDSKLKNKQKDIHMVPPRITAENSGSESIDPISFGR